MTTDKPEVAAYLHTNKENPEHRGVSLHHDASCTNTLVNTEPLIRLSDYERLQAKCRILESELTTVKKVAYGNVDLLSDYEALQAEYEKLRRRAEQVRIALKERTVAREVSSSRREFEAKEFDKRCPSFLVG